MADNKAVVQIIWGVALVIAGIGMLYMIPQKMVEIQKQYSSGMVFLRLCFYLVAILLIGGGSKKIYSYYRGAENESSDN